MRTAETAVAFVERLKRDAAFQSRLARATGPAARLVIAREEGFDLSEDDIASVRRALRIEELSDEDLERIAGGVGTSASGACSPTGDFAVGVAGYI